MEPGRWSLVEAIYKVLTDTVFQFTIVLLLALIWYGACHRKIRGLWDQTTPGPVA